MPQRRQSLASTFNRLRELPGRALADFITRPVARYTAFSVHDAATLAKVIQPCDVLLVEGNLWVSNAIKYLTQSTWSHAALYVGNALDATAPPEDAHVLIEADINRGVIGAPLAKYARLNTRICRPLGLTSHDKSQIIGYMVRHLGNAYDLKNIIDLARYLLPTPPVPMRLRRRMIALGSGDPTRAICSSLIALAFQSVRYPILPEQTEDAEAQKIVHHIRHHSLFTPRDFDLSPYFSVVKPTVENGFDYRAIEWATREGP